MTDLAATEHELSSFPPPSPGGQVDPARSWTAEAPAPGARASAPVVPKRLATTPVLATTVLCATVAFGLAGWQVARVMVGQDRIGIFSWIELVAVIIAAVGTVTWTWMIVESARRLVSAGVQTDAPSPSAVAAAWTMPLVVAAASITAATYLERRLNSPEIDETSVAPLAVACVALVVAMLVSYRPLSMLSAVMRRIGAQSGSVAKWIWVPLTLAVAGAATLFGLRIGGAYGDEVDGFAPAWALGVVAIPPVLVLLALAWRGGRSVEESIRLSYDRRAGTSSAGIGRGRITMATRLMRADARPAIARDVLDQIRLVPGTAIVRLAMMTAVAALTLVSVVGALVMFLFWREAADGALLPTQRERAWDALAGLQSLERLLAAGLVALATMWSFISVLNARLASGRRRNPVLAAAAWPFAAWGIWAVGNRYADTDGIDGVVTAFALQAVVLYVPFLLLERSAVSVGARRGPLRLSYALGVVLLVHIQGLGGLSTVTEVSDPDSFGRIAGYLVLAAVLELIVTIAVTEASTLISDAAGTIADKHNFLAQQRGSDGARPPTAREERASFETAAMYPSGSVGAPVTMTASSSPVPPPPTW